MSEKAPVPFVWLSPAAHAARKAYLRELDDRLRTARMAGVTDPTARAAAQRQVERDPNGYLP